MSHDEVMQTPFAEMCDLISCMAIDNGTAVPVQRMSQEQVVFGME